MNVVSKVCIRDCKCNDCNKLLKENEDNRVAIITNKKDIILCETCYRELVVKICTANID